MDRIRNPENEIMDFFMAKIRPKGVFVTLLTTEPSEKDANDLQSLERLELVKVWDKMFKGARGAVERRGFIGVHNMPELVGITGACENVDTLFKVDYFGKQAYLAQSDQLYLELLTPHLDRVYAEIQSFRMEEAADDRHLCQFSLFEIEMQGNLDDLIETAEDIVQSACNSVLNRHANGMSRAWYAHAQKHRLDDIRFNRITYTDAVEVLQGAFPWLKWGDDLKANHEKKLTDLFGPVFVTHYPKPIKFFNMKENAENPEVVNSCDLLLPFAGESMGAAERETEHDRIEARLKESDMYARLIELGGKDEDFEWYLNAHKGKDIPLHSGAGIGMARLAQFILGKNDIRECVPFLINSENLL